ncbi:uncharacterized protein [Globicephala melas]|uniref:uncharacterized protein isoform X4 n=1 Tax=Globicephala melas TaxID=9731 RepID=UPI00293D76D7|nr:uncharacterized protein LOC115846124 isoform X3 [Globicephala melas]
MRSAPPPVRMPGAAGALPNTDPLSKAGAREVPESGVRGKDGEGKGRHGAGIPDEGNGARGKRQPGQHSGRLGILDTKVCAWQEYVLRRELSLRGPYLVLQWPPRNQNASVPFSGR